MDEALTLIVAKLTDDLASLLTDAAQVFKNVGQDLRSIDRGAAGPDSAAVPDFTRRLRAESSALVADAVARVSLQDRALTRAELRAATGLSEAQLNGATGDLGRKFAFVFGRDVVNPFRGRPSSDGGHLYSIPAKLASAVLDALHPAGQPHAAQEQGVAEALANL